MKIRKYAISRIIACCILLLLTICIIILGNSCSRDDINDGIQDTESNKYSKMYEDIISPKMLKDSVSTSVVVTTGDTEAEIRYAMSGVNSLVSYRNSNPDGDYLFELWNNMEKYFLRYVDDGEEKCYSVEIQNDDDRKNISSCIYGLYITLSSYLGVANKDRVVLFEDLGDGKYRAEAELSEGRYELIFTVGDYLSNIEMKSDEYPDSLVNITFSKFNLNEQSEFEDTDDTCSVSHVLDVLQNGTS